MNACYAWLRVDFREYMVRHHLYLIVQPAPIPELRLSFFSRLFNRLPPHEQLVVDVVKELKRRGRTGGSYNHQEYSKREIKSQCTCTPLVTKLTSPFPIC